MPTLGQLKCSIEWRGSGIELPEWRVAYDDKKVDCYVPVPPGPSWFQIVLKSQGVIPWGLAMLVYIGHVVHRLNLCKGSAGGEDIDGSLQCILVSHKIQDVELRCSHREVTMEDGRFYSGLWRFHRIFTPTSTAKWPANSIDAPWGGHHVGQIAVHVLRLRQQDNKLAATLQRQNLATAQKWVNAYSGGCARRVGGLDGNESDSDGNKAGDEGEGEDEGARKKKRDSKRKKRESDTSQPVSPNDTAAAAVAPQQTVNNYYSFFFGPNSSQQPLPAGIQIGGPPAGPGTLQLPVPGAWPVAFPPQFQTSSDESSDESDDGHSSEDVDSSKADSPKVDSPKELTSKAKGKQAEKRKSVSFKDEAETISPDLFETDESGEEITWDAQETIADVEDSHSKSNDDKGNEFSDVDNDIGDVIGDTSQFISNEPEDDQSANLWGEYNDENKDPKEDETSAQDKKPDDGNFTADPGGWGGSDDKAPLAEVKSDKDKAADEKEAVHGWGGDDSNPLQSGSWGGAGEESSSPPKWDGISNDERDDKKDENEPPKGKESKNEESKREITKKEVFKKEEDKPAKEEPKSPKKEESKPAKSDENEPPAASGPDPAEPAADSSSTDAANAGAKETTKAKDSEKDEKPIKTEPTAADAPAAVPPVTAPPPVNAPAAASAAASAGVPVFVRPPSYGIDSSALYWQGYSDGQMHSREPPQRIFDPNVVEGPYILSPAIVAKHGITHQVHAGRLKLSVPESESSAEEEPDTIDTAENPYARFVFRYRGQKELTQREGVNLIETRETRLARIKALNYEELQAWVLDQL